MTDVTTFQCTKCGHHKAPEKFEIRKDTGKRRRQCKACMQGYKKIKYEEGDFQYWIMRIVKEARRRSKKKAKNFNLTTRQIIQLYNEQNGKCALTGRKIDTKRGSRLSIDKINSSGIYEIGNIQLVCAQVNFAKHVLSNEEFLQLCKEVVNFYGHGNGNKNFGARSSKKDKRHEPRR